MNLFSKLSRLFKRKQPDLFLDEYDEYDGPLFDLGDRVLVINPNLTDFPEEPPETSVISAVIYLPELDKYVYRLEGSPFYFNENWLQGDVFGPMTYPVYVDSSADIIDDLLDIYAWNKRMYERTGDESYAEKMESIEERLKELTVEK